jgi:hypothetical protein
LELTLQPVLPDSNGNYAPAQASGWLALTTNGTIVGVGISQTSSTTFTLAMSGMSPNYMSMVSISFILDSTPMTEQTWGPVFGVYPSTPITAALQPATLPAFLQMDPNSGLISPDGVQASPASATTYSMTITNSLGSASASFAITVAAATQQTSAPHACALISSSPGIRRTGEGPKNSFKLKFRSLPD